MTRQPEIWECLKGQMTRSQWTELQDIYKIVKSNLALDHEDFEAQSPTSDIPKWMRNVRNVLQYRKNQVILNGMVSGNIVFSWK